MSTLKELTLEKHTEAEEQPFIKSIFTGQVDRAKYIDYLYQLLVLYQNLEWHGSRLGIFKGIDNIKRAKAIELDYNELIGDGASSGKLNASTINYINYLETIKDDATKMLAHVYVRHMGDMFGGQMLAKLLPGSNRMFQFENLPQLVANVRQKLDVSLAEEANVAFTHNINMLKDYND